MHGNDLSGKWLEITLMVGNYQQMAGNGCTWLEWLKTTGIDFKLLDMDGMAVHGCKWL